MDRRDDVASAGGNYLLAVASYEIDRRYLMAIFGRRKKPTAGALTPPRDYPETLDVGQEADIQ